MTDWIRRGVALVVLAAAGASHALTITTNFASDGERIPSIGLATAAPTAVLGGGDLESIVRAAADAWEALIPDKHDFTLSFGWYDTTLVSNAAYHVPGAAGGWPTRTLSGSVAFNSNLANDLKMFVDPTPTVNEEFRYDHRTFLDLGAGPIEVSRQYVGTTEASRSSIDLYTTALHEIGHALGLTSWDFYNQEASDGKIDVTLAPFAGTDIPIHSTHLDLPDSMLSKWRFWGQRREITQTDLLAVCQINGFSQCEFELAPAEFAGDLNDDGVVNAADYTVWRDATSSAARAADSAQMTAGYDTWSSNFGRTFQQPETFSGDYNADGVVNAADYTAFRDHVANGDLRSDGNGDGALTTADWQVWANRYGERSPAATTAPEPSATFLATIAVLTACRRRR
ncbi:hypothetical protein Pla108_00040 [Botrimarina colliarenosi]|uniref:Matrixin n=1 Tax=Botrimarina colliarenosi TaxID=2528001 RepID=A0A5C6AJ31_9BACT|nr:dockerin type I repeat-containing protein [Botrimarina colliarenosi]TWT99071.1 hypothetical protein Pla108_00040 [Botrimarina colliarenosi]